MQTQASTTGHRLIIITLEMDAMTTSLDHTQPPRPPRQPPLLRPPVYGASPVRASHTLPGRG